MAVYRILDKLGQGGMGVVYRAIQESLDREVALKLLLDTTIGQATGVARFVREVQCAARISHPNIIRVLDYGEIEGQPFYAMEYLPVPTLKQLVTRDGPLGFGQAIEIARQLLDALSCIHRARLIHRDLKPANIMIGKGNHVTLMDFGLVKDLARTILTRQGIVVGTPGYLAPEAILGRPVDGRSDLFALGSVMYEALAGVRPFEGATIRDLLGAIVRNPHLPLTEHRSDCPAWLAGTVDRLLAKKPEDRYPSASAALNAIRRALGEAVEPDERDETVDPMESLPADQIDPLAPVPQSSIEGGLDTLRRALDRPETAAAAPVPGPTPSRRTGRSSPIRRTTRKSVVAPPDPRRRWPVVLLGAALAIVAAIVVIVVHGPTPLTTAVVPTPTAPSLSPSPDRPPRSESRSVPLVGQDLLEALRALDAPAQIKQIHRSLRTIRQLDWFSPRPVPEMIRLRETWAKRLRGLARSQGLVHRLPAFATVKERFYTSPEVSPARRISLYLATHDLVSLCLYCERFDIDFPLDAQSALWEGYGQTRRSTPGHEAAACLGFRLTPEHEGLKLLRLDDLPAGWTVRRLDASERFHEARDARETSLVDSITEGAEPFLEYRIPEALPIPELSKIESLELSAYVSDIHKNAYFSISFSPDGKAFSPMAVFRGEMGGQPQLVFHRVERTLLTGQKLFLKVSFVVLPQMDAMHEYAQIPRLMVHYRVKRAGG